MGTASTDTYDIANAGLSVPEDYPVITFTRSYDTSIETFIEAKSSLTNSGWQNVSANFTLIGRTNNGDGTEDVTYKMADPVVGSKNNCVTGFYKKKS
jgi:hypothetical protein